MIDGIATASRTALSIFSLVALPLVLQAGGARAQPAAIAISRNADLAFGQLVAGVSSGTVTIAPSGARSASGGVLLGNGTNVSVGSFTVSGEPLATYAITLPASVTLSNGGQTITLNAFTSDPSGAGTLNASGTQTITVGATLEVGASQPSAGYTGSFMVQVDYN